ncbi:HTH-type transcriptional regulator BetI [Austwickia sp. TVS 96-490-7B]|uniref:TetR/AcrR family transcriptional regulator n=1 Tax=Austwickia sp. TVS 96-490-7B TaxID=2830843 RepID=UPI001C565737|nr:TetR/AcrR family transcriptional regulator [Austwickia sp. TVS 96-490-7B]MBW3086533.1 HTH-type transcriptional regulator BetI [Austwickia sp. TVS 96-490-7B]
MNAARTKGLDGRSARRHDTKLLILGAATELFALRGVTATSMDDIAEHAGIAKGSLYYNFSSKSGLVEALMAQSVSTLRASIDSAMEGLTGRAARQAVIAAVLAEMQRNPNAARLMAAEVFRTDRDWRTTTQAWREVMMTPLAAGLMADDPAMTVDTAAVRAAAIVGATLMAGLEWMMFRPELPYKDVLAAALTAIDLTCPQ